METMNVLVTVLPYLTTKEIRREQTPGYDMIFALVLVKKREELQILHQWQLQV
jgi:hypothetical protein